MIRQNSKVKIQKRKLEVKSFLTFNFLIVILTFAFYLLTSTVKAISPTPSVTGKLTPSPTGSTTPGPTSTEDEKVKEIRDAVKEKVNEIKEKIEKRAYVGTIDQITDSTLTLNNFRGKQRVRVDETTIIVGSNKKEIKAKELALEDKVIALGMLGENEILEAKRVVVVAIPKTLPAKRLVFFGLISKIDSKSSLLTLTAQGADKTLEIKVEKNSLSPLAKAKTTPKFTDLKEGQKVVAVYLEPDAGKTPSAKSLFVLP